VRHETLGNLSHLPDPLIDLIRRSLAGEQFVAAAGAFQVERSLPHGHVQAVEEDLYRAMRWLLARQPRIESKLAQRRLHHGAIVWYHVSSSYYEGRTCPLARFGHDREGQKGRPIIVKSPAQVERAFRCLKGIDLRIRPIHHRSADPVRAHIFLCMLAYYVEWHMRRALAPLVFAEEELERNRRRDPAAPPKPPAPAQRKKITRMTPDGFPVHSFDTLLEILGARCRNLCRIRQQAGDATFQPLTTPTALQARAFELLGVWPDTGSRYSLDLPSFQPDTTSCPVELRASPNTVHFTILIRLEKSMRRVGWRLRGRRW